MHDKFDYFIVRTEKDLTEIKGVMNQNHQALLQKIDDVTSWKWISFGIYLAVSSIAGGAMGLLAIWVEYKK